MLLFALFRNLSAQQAIELRDGVYYPMGGFARVGEALGTVCEDLGVKFRFDCPVSEVRAMCAPPVPKARS